MSWGCASCAPRQGETGFAFPIVRFHPGSSCPQAAALKQSPTRSRRPPPFPRDSCVSWHTVNLRGAHLAPIIRTSEHFHVFSPPPHLSVRMFGSGVKKRANSPRLSPRRNAPLVAAASRRSRARKRSVFDRRPRIAASLRGRCWAGDRKDAATGANPPNYVRVRWSSHLFVVPRPNRPCWPTAGSICRRTRCRTAFN